MQTEKGSKIQILKLQGEKSKDPQTLGVYFHFSHLLVKPFSYKLLILFIKENANNLIQFTLQ